jgi:hypothetical protein
MKAKDILTDQSRWTRGAFARDEHGKMCDPEDDEARSWCVFGALRRAYLDTFELENAMRAVAQNIPPLKGYGASIAIMYWNDYPSRTFEDVRKVIEQADV